jgi:hypothetical protein
MRWQKLRKAHARWCFLSLLFPHTVAFPRLGQPASRRSPPTSALIALLLCWVATSPVSAGEVELNPNLPESYTVQPGDTLWSIASHFLRNPWQWPEIWRDNPQVRNPNRIYPGEVLYPGDVLVLDQDSGRPQLRVDAPSELRLSPQVRSRPITGAIPAIPLTLIAPFLSQPRVMSAAEFERQPYVVALAEEHIVGGAGNRIYVRSIESGSPSAYMVFRAGEPYRDADTGAVLGNASIFIADTQLEQFGDPATLLLTRTEKEVRIGDRLLPFESEQVRIAFEPHAPKSRIAGHIIGVLDGVTQIGQFSVVALDRGTADGIEPGHVMQIWQKGPVVRDIVRGGFNDTIGIPSQKAGILMVFRPFERVSFALVMSADRFIHVLDAVQTP